MALPITITDAGRAEIINAQNTGTGPVTITEIGFGTGQYTPTKTLTALQAQIKRVSSIAGQAVAADTIHVTAVDESSAAYNVGEFGLFSDKGTLIAVYSQPAASGWIIQKAGASTLLLATDIILESLNATSITFGDISFLNPPATETVPGVVMLENTLTSSSTSRALTAAMGKKLHDEKQPKDATLTALAALITAANKLIYATGSDTFATADLTAFARSLLADADAAAARATLGAQPLDSTLTALAGVVTAANKLIYATGQDSFATADLTAFARSLLDDADAAAARETLGLVKQSGSIDTTAGRVMTVGAFGLGSAAIGLATPNLNDERTTGFYYCNSPTNSPAAENGWLLHEDLSVAGYAAQTYKALSGRVFQRVQSGGAWRSWVELFHSGNVSPFIQSLLDDDSAAVARDTLGAQASDPTLTALAALVTAANKLIYATGSDTFATADLTAFARTLLDDADAAAARLTLGAAPVESPTFTGSPKVPTALATDSGTSAANTSHVKAAMALYGIGGQAVSTEVDLNTYKIGGAYVTPSSGLLNLPSGWTQGRHIILVSGGASYAAQLLYGANANVRRQAIRIWDGTVWSAWDELWHSGNTIKQANLADTTAGAFMQVGAFGLGGTGIPVADYNTTPNGNAFIYAASGSTPNKPGGGSSYAINLFSSGFYAHQLGAGVAENELRFRNKNNGVWGAWNTLLHTGNTSSFIQTLFDDADAAAARSTLGITVADGGLGYGQVWQDVTASRAWATTYTNTTGKPILVSVIAQDTVSGNLQVQLTVNGVVVARHYNGGNMEATVAAIVPPGGTYKADRFDTNDKITVWAELR
ncbi:phage tail protein [Stutzerimonas kunmingensis]|uniref:phage tail-collar fiber domain-containing protein n=1 Tax=Stutzerimonas kunmingensis TaxID=1211807 RepID=UPI002102FACC|nr:phage tail protein [Stutzerimonas kunmingensis]MCQ2035179.1 phage tail protein [Stutzerimonas kunmingensis]